MKKMILSTLLLATALFAQAQVTPQAASTPAPTSVTPPAVAAPASTAPLTASAVSTTERSEWLPSFSTVVVAASADVRFIQVTDAEAPQITYDTKGSYTTKFQAEVRDQTLYIREKSDSRRPERTTVTVRYNALRAVTITDATVKFENPLSSKMLDIVVGARSSLTADIQATDLNLDVSGDTAVKLTGAVRYLTLTASTGRVDLLGVETTSAQVNAQSQGDVRLTVTERLVARTSTGATIHYKGKPTILRISTKLFAGDIKSLE